MNNKPKSPTPKWWERPENLRQPLSPIHQKICDDIRSQVSPLVAGWVENKFRAGQSQNEVFAQLEAMRDLVGVDLLEGTEDLKYTPTDGSDKYGTGD